jgi:hypothetical protein
MLGANDAHHIVHRFAQAILPVDDHVIKGIQAVELLARGGDANFERVGRFSPLR